MKCLYRYQDGAAALIDSGSSDIVLDTNTYNDVIDAVIGAFEGFDKTCQRTGTKDKIVLCFCDESMFEKLPVFSLSVMSVNVRQFSASNILFQN